MKPKTKYIITGVIVIILLGGASVFLVWFQTNHAPEVLGESTQTSQNITAQNTTYGFSYEYPNNLFVDQETNSLTWLYNPSPFNFLQSPKTTDGTAISGIQVQVYDNTDNLTLADWLKKQPKFPTFTTTQKTLASGVDVFFAETTNKDWNARSTYFVKLQQAVLQISFYANNEDLATRDMPMFEKLVNSLKVSVQNQTVSTETYQNGTVGFLIDYPSNMKLDSEDYDAGKIAFLDDTKKLEVYLAYGGSLASAKDLAGFVAQQEEARQVSKPLETKVASFQALVSTLSDSMEDSYYYVQTSTGYFTFHVRRAKDITPELKVAASNMLNSFRVYELVSTKGWQNYASSDGKIHFQYPADASIENLANGVQVDQENVKIGVYAYQNLGLSITDWVDNAQLNKYKGSDSRHFAFQVKSKIDGKEALRTVDPVSKLKLATYIVTNNTMYIAEMAPFDVKNAKDLALYNTILSTIKLK